MARGDIFTVKPEGKPLAGANSGVADQGGVWELGEDFGGGGGSGGGEKSGVILRPAPAVAAAVARIIIHRSSCRGRCRRIKGRGVRTPSQQISRQ